MLQPLKLATAKQKTIWALVSFYDVNCRKCGTGRYTRTDTKARKGICAVDPKYIPLGSYVYIKGFGRLHAEDTGGKIKGMYRIDICTGKGPKYHNQSVKFGIQRKRITIYYKENKNAHVRSRR